MSTMHSKTGGGPTSGGLARAGYLAAAMCLAALTGYSGLAVVVLAPRLRGYFGIGPQGYGMLLSSGIVGSLPAFVIMGPLIDRWGAKRMLGTALAGVGGGFALCAVGTALPLFVIGLVVTGFFHAALGLTVPTYAVRLYPSQHRRVLSLSFMAYSIPSVIFPGIIDRLMTAMPDRFALVLHVPYAAGAALLCVAPFLLIRAPSDVEHSADVRRERVSLREEARQLSRPALLFIMFLTVLHGTSDATFSSWFPTYAQLHFARMPMRAGDVLALCAVAYVAVRAALSVAPETLGRRALLVVPGVLGGAILLACLWSDNAVLLCVGFPIASLAWAAEYPAVMAEASRQASRHFASFLALSSIAMQLSMALSLPLTGALVSVFGATEAAKDLLGPAAPWWMPDLRLAVTFPALGFILFGVLAGLSRLGRGDPDVT